MEWMVEGDERERFKGYWKVGRKNMWGREINGF